MITKEIRVTISKDPEITRRVVLSRCRDAAYVCSAREGMSGMDPRRAASVRSVLKDLVASGQVREIQVPSMVVYIAW
jgi:hypothetical protein